MRWDQFRYGDRVEIPGSGNLNLQRNALIAAYGGAGKFSRELELADGTAEARRFGRGQGLDFNRGNLRRGHLVDIGHLWHVEEIATSGRYLHLARKFEFLTAKSTRLGRGQQLFIEVQDNHGFAVDDLSAFTLL